MRILIANSNRKVVGGAETYLQAILPALQARGHEIAVVYEHSVRDQAATIEPQTDSETWCASELGMAAVLQLVKTWRPDVVYNNGLENTVLERELIRGRSSFLFAHNYYGTCATGSKCFALPSARPCTREFGPACLFLHYPRRCGGMNPLTTWQLYRKQVNRSRELAHYKAIFVASQHMEREYLRHGVPRGRIHLLPLPIMGIRPTPEPPGRKDLSGQILFVSRLTSLKGGDYLIRAIGKARQFTGPLHLTIAGDGPERKKLERLAGDLNVPVHFPGWVSLAQKHELMSNADILAVPSLWPEPFGLVGIEAGCLGLPSVGFAVGGIPEWLISGYSGELAPASPPTVDGLSEAIVHALRDPQHHAHLRRGAWEIARRFTLAAHLSGLEAFFEAQCGPMAHVNHVV